MREVNHIEFFVLNLLIKARRPTWHLLQSEKTLIGRFGGYHPGYPAAEIAQAISHLVASGYLVADQNDEPQGWVPTKLPACDVPLTKFLELSREGSEMWERIAAPNWQSMLHSEYCDDDDEHSVNCVASSSDHLERLKVRLEDSYNSELLWIGPVAAVKEWNPWYWKTLRNGVGRRARLIRQAEPKRYDAQQLAMIREWGKWIEYGFFACQVVATPETWPGRIAHMMG